MNISVIVPAYNSQAYVGKCLEALLAQTLNQKIYEVIVVDDGSTDKTADTVKSYPVKYVYQKNQGPATARNRGVKEAKGDIILFTDSDCVPTGNWIEEMIKPFKSPDIAAVKGAYLTNQKEVVARLSQVEFEERFEMLKKAESIDMVDTYSAGFRKAIFVQMGGFDTTFPVANNEDTDLSYRMSSHGYKMVFNPDAVVYHLKHPDSIKKYSRLKFWRGYWRMVVYKRFPDKMLKDTYTPQTLKLQILFLFLFLTFLSIFPVFPSFMVYPVLVTIGAFCILSLPFTLLTLRRDPVVAPFAPLFLVMRALSLGSGMLWGIYKNMGSKTPR